MATKTPTIVNNMYAGRMNNTEIDTVMEIRNSKLVPILKNTILNFPPELVIESIEKEVSIRKLVRDRGLKISDYVGEMRDYQTIGTAFMYFSKRSMIADGVGLGKTVEIASLINLLYNKREIKRFLMAVETGAIVQTQCELIKFTGLNIVVLPSTKVQLMKKIEKIDWNTVDGIVISHTLLRSDTFSKFLALNIDVNGKCRIFDTFILDESSCIKNNETKMYRYTYNICQLANRVHFMNATAFETCIMDIYYQIDMMNCDLLPKESKIKSRYCEYSRETFWRKGAGGASQAFAYKLSGYKNQKDFKESLKLVYFGRTKKDVGLDLPHTYKVYEVEPTVKQISAIARHGKYNEILNCPSLVAEANIPTNSDEVPKIARLVDLVKNEFSGSNVMIYVFHRKAQEVIRDKMLEIGRKPLILNGETEQIEKFKVQTEFNEGECDVLITNVKKSLNLYGGDVCIFYSLITNPASMFQAAGRIDRNVDKRIKTFILMLYKGTDEYNFFRDVVAQRSQDAKDLTIEVKTAVDYFLEAMGE